MVVRFSMINGVFRSECRRNIHSRALPFAHASCNRNRIERRCCSKPPPLRLLLHSKRHISVAIVGSGPSGCYTAKYLLNGFAKMEKEASLTLTSSFKKPTTPSLNITVLDRLPTPYGLVRYGVAPDHPEVKNVQNDFDTLFETQGVRFAGNVQVGTDVSVAELRDMFDIVVLSYGCESDRKLGVPGEHLDGVLSAREFVAWYNGHPCYGHIGEKVARALGVADDKDNIGTGIRDANVVVVGNGNVALDCARVLAKAGNGLYHTDLAARALTILGDGVTNVSIVGRRGHMQGAFTIKELRELVNLESEGYNTSFVVQEDELDMGATESSIAELNGPQGRPKTRINQLLRETAAKSLNLERQEKCIRLRFLLNPIRFESNEEVPTSLGALVCERNRLEGEPGRQRAIGTEEYETLPAQLALVSIGYKAVPLLGTEQWFDDKQYIMRNHLGRIEEPKDKVGGLYAAGWVKRGPSGIIGTNIADAKETVTTILSDMTEYGIRASPSNLDFQEVLRSRDVHVVEWEGYRRIEKEESARRRSDNQPREKIATIEDLLLASQQ